MADNEARVKLVLNASEYDKQMRARILEQKKFERSISNMIAPMTKFAAGIASVTTAMKVMKDVFLASERNLDTWGRALQAGEASYTTFVNTLNSADFTNFFTKINQVVQAAHDAYNSMDELNTFKAFNQRKRAETQADYANAVADYKANPTKANKDALTKANNALIANLQEEKTFTQNAYKDAVTQKLIERTTDPAIQKTIRGLLNSGDYTTGWKAIRDKYDARTGYFNGERVARNLSGEYFTTNKNGERARTLSAKEVEQINLAKALWDFKDEDLQELQALGMNAFNIDTAIGSQRKSFNRAIGSGGTTKTTGTTKTKPSPGAKTKFQYYINDYLEESLNEAITMGSTASGSHTINMLQGGVGASNLFDYTKLSANAMPYQLARNMATQDKVQSSIHEALNPNTMQDVKAGLNRVASGVDAGGALVGGIGNLITQLGGNSRALQGLTTILGIVSTVVQTATAAVQVGSILGLIPSKAFQGGLVGMVNDGTIGGGVELTAKLSGEDIYLSNRNYMRKNGK